MPDSWARVNGSGRLYQGPCVLKGIVFTSATTGDTVIVYDGLDATSGKRMFTLIAGPVGGKSVNFGEGLAIESGIYVVGTDSDVETMVWFVPLDD